MDLEATMFIRYANGEALEAILLSATDTTVRVAIEGCEDSLDFTRIHGVWVSDDCEPVQVEFSWARQRTAPQVAEDDCVCSRKLAARLIYMLHAGDRDGASLPSARTSLDSYSLDPVLHQ